MRTRTVPLARRRPNELESATETDLVAWALAGEEAAFVELVLRHSARIRDLLRRLSGNDALADDLAQTAFLRAWRRLGQIHEPEAFGGWLKRIAVNAWLDEARRAAAFVEPGAELFEALPDPAPSPERHAVGLDVQRALADLKPDERLCVVLAYGEDFSHSEIAAIVGLPLGTVKSHILRGAAKLRQILGGAEQR